MPSELKSCPFCGGTNIRFDEHNGAGRGMHSGETVWSMCCYDCGATLPNRYRRELLEDAWNTRSEPATPAGDDALVEELAQLLSETGYAACWDHAIQTARAIKPILHRERAAAHAAGRAAERAEETGWLIEHADEPKWLTLRPGEACFEVCWTTASLEALRFARRTDAEDYVSANFGGDGPIRITEHMWSAAIERGQHEGSKGDE